MTFLLLLLFRLIVDIYDNNLGQYTVYYYYYFITSLHHIIIVTF